MTGGFSFSMLAFYAAVVLNVPLSLLLLALYRRAVVREMGTDTGISAVVPVPPATSLAGMHSSTTLTIDKVDADTPLTIAHAATERSVASLKMAALVSAGAGLLFVLVITIGWYLTLGGRFYFVWSLWWLALNGWPIPLTIGLVTGATGADWKKLIGLYAVVFVALSATSLALYDNLEVVTLSSDALTTLLIALPVSGLLYRPIRAVGLLVFVFMLTVLAISPPLVFALLDAIVELSFGEYSSRAPVLVLLSWLGAEGVAILAMLSVVTITGALGWWVLNQIGRAYRSKRLSDHSLMLDSLWAVAALSHITLLASQQGGLAESWAWIFFPIAAFGTYWLAERIGRAVLFRPAVPRGVAPILLLLRVFSLGKRSEQLLDVLAPRWLRTGSIAFIAGPDLATATVQPDQFLEYLARRIRRKFVRNEADLSRRLSELDLQPDPDGRYRVNQLLCFADTWQSAVRQLARRANAVLMDLRSFSEVNQGCLYELQQLLEHVAVGRILLIIDGTTDWQFLEATLHRLWASTSGGSPNRASGSSRLRVFRLERLTSREVHKIIQLVIDAEPALAVDELQAAGH